MSGKVERAVTPSAGEVLLSGAEDALREYAVAAQAKDERIEKLETLVRDMWASCFAGAEGCKRCSLSNECGYGTPCKVDEDGVAERMRELGIEVG